MNIEVHAERLLDNVVLVTDARERSVRVKEASSCEKPTCLFVADWAYESAAIRVGRRSSVLKAEYIVGRPRVDLPPFIIPCVVVTGGWARSGENSVKLGEIEISNQTAAFIGVSLGAP